MHVISNDEPQLLVERSGSIGRIRLNRPRALNSLTLDMVRRTNEALDSFEEDPDVAVILVTGEGERGLAAGGDIRAIYESGRAGTSLAESFWREEYRLNARIARFPKPYVAVMDGITMGGGVGISAHGSHRIVTERTRLAMPETGIGYFPDVGASWLLTRGAGELGTYLGLTGHHIGAADAIATRLADFFVPADRLAGLADALTAIPADASTERVTQICHQFSEPAPPPLLYLHREMIDRTFAFDTVEEIMSSLAALTSEFASKARDVLLAKSPTSLKLTLRLLRLGRASESLEDCLEREFISSLNMLRSQDFFVGVRAAVIDKDRQPRWSPATLDEVDDEAVERHLRAGASHTPVFASSKTQRKFT